MMGPARASPHGAGRSSGERAGRPATPRRRWRRRRARPGSRELVHDVRERIGPVAAFKEALVVARLPKTRSGKVLRGTMRAIADGQPYKMPATIDDPAVLTEIAATLAAARRQHRGQDHGSLGPEIIVE